MTPAESLGYRWPVHTESHNPKNSIFLRVDDQIFLGPTEMIHVKLEQFARQSGFPKVETYTDAGEIITRSDGSLQIRKYHETQVRIGHFRGEFIDPDDMENQFDEIRKKTAGLICQQTGKVVWVELHTGELYEVSF